MSCMKIWVINVENALFLFVCIEDILKHLLLKCEQFAQPEGKQPFGIALNDDIKQTALLINKLFIHIPTQITVREKNFYLLK